jgi:YD repeat-containing protein
MRFPFRALFAGLSLACALATPVLAVDVTYTYDALGRLTSATYACSASSSYVYDPAGNRTSTATAAQGACPPVAVNDSVTTAFNTPATFDPRTNDSDPNGYALTISSATAPGHGAAIVNSGASITYTPTTGYSGADSFTYTISNGHSGTATATVAVTVSAAANRAPVAVNDSITTPQNTADNFDPRVNDSDPDGDTLAITGVGTPGHGTASVVGTTSVTYTPTTGYSGIDSFAYTISDGRGGTAGATVSVTVTAAENSPHVPGLPHYTY